MILANIITTSPSPPVYYLVNQVVVSSLLGLTGFLLGMILAWIIWGRRGKKLKKAKTDHELLRQQWEKVNPAPES